MIKSEYKLFKFSIQIKLNYKQKDIMKNLDSKSKNFPAINLNINQKDKKLFLRLNLEIKSKFICKIYYAEKLHVEDNF